MSGSGVIPRSPDWARRRIDWETDLEAIEAELDAAAAADREADQAPEFDPEDGE